MVAGQRFRAEVPPAAGKLRPTGEDSQITTVSLNLFSERTPDLKDHVRARPTVIFGGGLGLRPEDLPRRQPVTTRGAQSERLKERRRDR